jgi:phosphoribosylformylglycinamidine synthase
VPIAHHDGNYFADKNIIKLLEDNNQIAFRYCNSQGELSDGSNPNGSVVSIAGVYNSKKNVLGMMPHPERHSDAATGGVDGRALFESLLAAA